MISFKGKHFEKSMWAKAIVCSFEMLAIRGGERLVQDYGCVSMYL